MLFGSERQNQGNLYSLDLESGEIVQLTALPAPGGQRASFQSACVNPSREEAHFWHRRTLYAIDLANSAPRPLWSAPDGWQTGILNATADGRSLCTALTEDLSSQIRMDLGSGYVGFQ